MIPRGGIQLEQKYKHVRRGTIYETLYFTPVKVDGFWTSGIAYRQIGSGIKQTIYTRTTYDFRQDFEEFPTQLEQVDFAKLERRVAARLF